jgi:hypothetical protein
MTAILVSMLVKIIRQNSDSHLLFRLTIKTIHTSQSLMFANTV